MSSGISGGDVMATANDISRLAGIDPLHPMLEAFRGPITDLPSWTRQEQQVIYAYRHLCAAVDPDGRVPRDPGPGVYLYMFTVGPLASLGEIVYVGITRNPHIRFKKHRTTLWWRRVTDAHIDIIDCRYHDGDVCTLSELDRTARMVESWMIDMFEPTENLRVV